MRKYIGKAAVMLTIASIAGYGIYANFIIPDSINTDASLHLNHDKANVSRKNSKTSLVSANQRPRKGGKTQSESVEFYLAELDRAIAEGNEIDIQKALVSLAGCKACIDDLIWKLNDQMSNEEAKIYAAKALIKSGAKDGIVAVLEAIVMAHDREEFDLKQGLMELITDFDTAAEAEILAIFVAGDYESQLNDLYMPDDFKLAIAKSIRYIPDSGEVGERLAQVYRNSSEEGRERLLKLKHPGMNAILTGDAYNENGENNILADTLIDGILSTADSSAINGLMALARNDNMPLDEVASLAYEWVDRNPQTQSFDQLAEYLSNTEYSPEERAVAAYALAASQNANESLYALEKASIYEEDPVVREYLEAVISTFDAGKSK